MDNPSIVADIFRDQADADRAMLELQHTDMNADQIKVTSYNLSNLRETHNSVEIQSESNQIVVMVEAKNETQEAANILGDNGANNADLPPGIILGQGIPVRTRRVREETHHEEDTYDVDEAFF